MCMKGCLPVGFEGVLRNMVTIFKHDVANSVTLFLLYTSQETDNKLVGGQAFVLWKVSPRTWKAMVMGARNLHLYSIVPHPIEGLILVFLPDLGRADLDCLCSFSNCFCTFLCVASSCLGNCREG